MDLQDAHLAGLAHHRAPLLGGELVVDALELDRVGTIAALQRAAMGQLGEHADGCEGAQLSGHVLAADHARGGLVVHADGLTMSVRLELLGHAFTYPLSAKPWSRSRTSAVMTSTGAEYSSASLAAISSTVLVPSQSCSTATAVWSGVRTRSGARSTHRPRPASWRSFK